MRIHPYLENLSLSSSSKDRRPLDALLAFVLKCNKDTADHLAEHLNLVLCQIFY